MKLFNFTRLVIAYINTDVNVNYKYEIYFFLLMTYDTNLSDLLTLSYKKKLMAILCVSVLSRWTNTTPLARIDSFECARCSLSTLDVLLHKKRGISRVTNSAVSHLRENKARRSPGPIIKKTWRRCDRIARCISHDRRKQRFSREEFLFETRARQSRDRCDVTSWFFYYRVFIERENRDVFLRTKPTSSWLFSRGRGTFPRHTHLVTHLWRGYFNISPQDYLSVCEKLRLASPDNQHPATSREMLLVRLI